MQLGFIGFGAASPVSAARGQQLNSVMGMCLGKNDTSALLRVLETGSPAGPAP